MTINLSMPNTEPELKPRITVIGVGGAGGNAVNNMIRANLEGVEFLIANTDAQAIQQSLCERRIQLGRSITRGLGAGSRPEVGRAAAEEVLDEILEHLQGSNMVFITAGMGGGTGTGAAPVIAEACRKQGILTVGVVTKPFKFEGAHRMRMAETGIIELQQFVDTLIIIPNQNLFRVANEKTTFADAFKMADDVLHSGVRGVTDLMVMPGLINLDFADIRTVMSEMGKAMMGTGEAEGDKRAILAAEAAISNPLLDDVTMKGARGVLINITGGMDMTLFEVDEAAERIRSEVDPDANIIFGSTFDDALEGRMRVSIVATGIEAEAASQSPPVKRPLLNVVSSRSTPSAAQPAPAARPAASTSVPVAPMLAPIVASAGALAIQTSIEPAPVEAAPAAEAIPAAEPIKAEATPIIVEPAAETVPAQVTTPQPAPMSEPRLQMPIPQSSRAAAPARADGPFIPRPPVDPLLQTSTPVRTANPIAEADMLNAGKQPLLKPRSTNLFQKITGLGLGRSTPKTPQPTEPKLTQPAAPATVRPAAGPAQQAMPEMERPARAADDDQLDIPAFLRRQAN
ncbi:MAG: cell division protein FtsZ [Alphaproteobacteria bacterium]|nr:cell division protein FtsZ [Alphaproteobacteria bacterium]